MGTTRRLSQGLIPFFLIWAMLVVTSMAVLQADFMDGMHVLPIVATLALFLGWLLANSTFSDRTVHFFALIYGLFFVFFLVGTTLPYNEPWRMRVLELVNRQIDWLGKAFSGGISRDGLIFVIQTSAVFWILGHLSAWYTFRHPHVWRVVIPTGVVLLSVVYYYNGPRPLLPYMAIYIPLALIFVAVTHLRAEENGWRAGSVRYDRGIRFDFVRSGFLAALLALVLAWGLPSLSASASFNETFSGASGPWRSFQDTWTRLFSSLRSYSAGASDPYQDTLVLGGPRTVGNSLVMDVQVDKELPYGVYWQAVTYDKYENGGWHITGSTISEEPHYPEDGPLNVPFANARTVITQTVTNYLPNSSLIYAAPGVVTADRPVLVDAVFDPEGRTIVTSLRSRTILRQGDQYQVTSRISLANATDLQKAGVDYPDWIRERYLQLPNTVTPRTIDLAGDLTAGLSNPYDKAIAVRDYLRSNINYNDQIDAPPDDAEPIDFIVFNLKEAYCTYYASAMAVMLRSQGIPARLASGYALGEYDEPSMSYRVRAINAHTWVEVYFTGYGWIHFEPTTSIPVMERPTSTASGQTAGGVDPVLSNAELFPLDDEVLNDNERRGGLFGEGATDGGPVQGLLDGRLSWPQIAAGVVLLVLAAGALYAGSAYNHRVEGDVDRSYLRLGDWARWLGTPWRTVQTPYEQADSLAAEVPDGQAPVYNLTHQYVIQQFSPAKSTGDNFDPHQEWRELRPILIKRRLRKYFSRPKGRK
ncbi:MAG: transglutaminase domain-containing protein [Candidatus Promineofilum sp.]|nr:transglutaminase domain-containing protein [Promineifilum sp.]MBP9657236.1 transglutaminase domain-containing protein [Promineifilum sp.]